MSFIRRHKKIILCYVLTSTYLTIVLMELYASNLVPKYIMGTPVKFMASDPAKVYDRVEVTDFWRKVPSHDGLLFIFSAFYDARPRDPVLRIIAAALKKREKPIYCVLPDESGKLVLIQGRLTFNSDDWELKYGPGRIECNIFKSAQIPEWVGIIGHDVLDIHDDFIPNVTLSVHHRSPESTLHKGNFAVCVQPLHGNFNKATALIEFIELYRIFGVSHFYLYDYSSGEDVKHVLDAYQDSGVVTVFPWQLDGISMETEFRVYGILGALNDCIYRSMFQYTYTIMVDIDEFIVPSEDVSHFHLIKGLQKNNTSAFIFQNAFFYLEWEDDSTWMSNASAIARRNRLNDGKIPYIATLAKFTRIMKPTGTKRTKYIARPEKLVAAGNHIVEHHWPGYQSLEVPPTIGLSQHYRRCVPNTSYCINNPSVTDRKIWRYANELIPRILRACAAAFPSTGRCP